LEDDIIFTEMIKLKVPKLKPGETFITSLKISPIGQNSMPVNIFTIIIESAKGIIIGMEKKFTV